jgi:hypothetical protein
MLKNRKKLKIKTIWVLFLAIFAAMFSQTAVYANEDTTFQKICAPAGWTECALWSIGVSGTSNWRSTFGPFPKEKFIATGHPDAEKYELFARIFDQTWIAQQAANTNRWIGVTYGNGLFVAIAWEGREDNRVMTSPDGITWTSRKAPKASWAKKSMCRATTREPWGTAMWPLALTSMWANARFTGWSLKTATSFQKNASITPKMATTASPFL